MAATTTVWLKHRHNSLQSHLWAVRVSGPIDQQTLAKKVGVSRRTIHRIESGQSIPTVETALRISKALDIPLEQIFKII